MKHSINYNKYIKIQYLIKSEKSKRNTKNKRNKKTKKSKKEQEQEKCLLSIDLENISTLSSSLCTID